MLALPRFTLALLTLISTLCLPAVGSAYLTDKQVRTPTSYDSFAPPSGEGGSYVDPVFGTKVTRLSVATEHVSPWNGTPWALVGNEYSSVNAINADNTKVLVMTGGPAGVFPLDGSPIVWLNYAYPVSGVTFRWSHTDPNILYYVDPDDAYYTGPDVAGPSHIKSLNLKTGEVKILRTFPQYTRLSFTGEDLSPDGNYMALLANGRYTFWYRISDNTVGPVIDRVSKYGYTTGEKGSQYMLGEVFVMANFHAATPGLMVFDAATMAYKFTTTFIDHRAFGIDADGTPVVVMDDWRGCSVPGDYSINTVNLRNGTLRTVCLPRRGGATDFYYSVPQNMPGWVLVTHVNVSGDVSPSSWLPFENEIFLMRFDGSEIRRLAHHRARPSEGLGSSSPTLPYWARPKAAISLDGTKVVYGSNYGLVRPTPTGNTGYQDTYVLDLGGSGTPTPPTAPPPPPAPDTTAPTVAITSPATNSVVSGSVTVAVSAADNVGVTALKYYLDGALVGVVSPPTPTFAWNSKSTADGFHTLSVTALDAAGNSAQTTRSFVVSNGEVDPLQFSSASYVVSESARNAVITVVRTGPTDGAVTVDYATSDGTAKAGVDYKAVSGRLTFAPGVVIQTFSVPVINNKIVDGDRTVNLRLSNPSGDALLGTPDTAVLTIQNEDVGGTVRFSASQYSASLKNAVATIKVTRSGGDAGGVTVRYATSGGTAAAGVNYTAVTGTLTFGANVNSVNILIPINKAIRLAAPVTVNLTLTDAAGATLGTPSTAVLTINK